MKLTFETQPEDIQRYARLHASSPHSRRLRSTAAILFFSMGSVFGLLVLTFSQRVVPALGALVMGILSAAFVWFRWNRSVAARIVKISETGSGGGLAGPKTMELRDDGLSWVSTLRGSLIPWSGFERLVATEGLSALYVNPTFALLVPDRAFSDLAARDEFRRTVEARTEKNFEHV